MLSKKQLYALSSRRRKEYLNMMGHKQKPYDDLQSKRTVNKRLRHEEKIQTKETLLSDVQATQDALEQEMETERRTRIEGL